MNNADLNGIIDIIMPSKTKTFQLGKNSSNTSKKRLIIIALTLLILAGLAAAYYFVCHKTADVPPQSDSAQTQSAKEIEIEGEKPQSPNAANQNLPVDSSTKTSEDIPTSSDLKVMIVKAQQETSRVEAEVTITGGDKLGTCVFLFTNPEDRPVTRQISSTGSLGAQNCKATIPNIEFNRLGTWRLKVTYYMDENKGEAQSEITIE